LGGARIAGNVQLLLKGETVLYQLWFNQSSAGRLITYKKSILYHDVKSRDQGDASLRQKAGRAHA
jgi:hypothetical protein